MLITAGQSVREPCSAGLQSWLSWRAPAGEASNLMLLTVFLACLIFTAAITYLITLASSVLAPDPSVGLSNGADVLCQWDTLYLPEVIPDDD